jgi:hypothetical protein
MSEKSGVGPFTATMIWLCSIHLMIIALQLSRIASAVKEGCLP